MRIELFRADREATMHRACKSEARGLDLAYIGGVLEAKPGLYSEML